MDLLALANLSSHNGYLPSWLGTTQFSVQSTAFYPYFGRKINGNKSQSRDKMLQILQKFVLCTAMMVANHYSLIDLPMLASAFFHLISLLLQRCQQVHVFHLVFLLLKQWSIPTSLYIIIIFKLFLFVYFYGLAKASF